MLSPSDSRVLFRHHLVLCVFGGFLLGLIACLGRGLPGLHDVIVNVAGWLLLAMGSAPLLWILVRHKPSWSTAAILTAAILGAGIALLIPVRAGLTFAIPFACLWLAAFYVRTIVPDVRAPGACHWCGYDLRGLPSPRCPECGTPFDPASVR